MGIGKARTAARLAAALLILSASAWCAGAFYLGPEPSPLAALLEAGAGILAAISLFVPSIRKAALPVFALAVLGCSWFWSRIEPSNDRTWAPEVALLPSVSMDGDQVTFRNVRDFEYRTETDFTPRYYDKTVSLSDLDSVDMIASYWMGHNIAHIFLSFGFAGRDYVAMSIETRKEATESYSTVKGFFRQYELFYVVADERDLIGVRTNYRKDPPEQVYVYRINAPTENIRRAFVDYVREINSLVETPQFYNTLTTNCTTGILAHSRVNPGDHTWSWKILLSGHAPEYVYDRGRLDMSLPFAELELRSLVNPAAVSGGDGPGFSQRIRQGLPDPRPASARASAKLED